MRNRFQLTSVSIVIVIILWAGTTVCNGQSQTISDDDDIPVVNYDAPPPTNPEERRIRETRGRKYDGAPPLTAWEGQSDVFDLLPAGQPAEEALPIQTSDLIVIGTAVDSKAYLSNDKTNVYSEFQIYVTKVLKQNSAAQVYTGSTVTAERGGGRVRFPSGHILLRGDSGRNLLTKESRYVLFLGWDANGKDYLIRTGYKVTNDLVYPLDGYPTINPNLTNSGLFKNFEEYKNTPLSGFLSKLAKSISNPKK